MAAGIAPVTLAFLRRFFVWAGRLSESGGFSDLSPPDAPVLEYDMNYGGL
jgi:hypothetical protein